MVSQFLEFLRYYSFSFKGFRKMELTDENLQTLSQFLQQTLSPEPDTRKQGTVEPA